jgi:Lrp/AsnC family leucine-responsive transcriptional regulator
LLFFAGKSRVEWLIAAERWQTVLQSSMQRQNAVREEEKRMPDKLDQFDRSILEVVQRDCQLKAEAIADKVGLSPSAVQRRLRRLRDEGIITAEIAVVNRKATSFPMTFITGMEIERDNYDALARFRAWADRQEHVQQVYYVTGQVDLVAIITARDVEHYDDITAQLMAENPQIRRMHTNVVLRDVKVGLHIPVRE